MTEHFQLDNGVHVVCEERPGTRKVSMQFVIGYGSDHEQVDENGLTFLTQEVVNGGTKTRSRNELADIIENSGASLVTVTSGDKTRFGITSLADDAEDLFDVLSDVILNPAYEQAEIDTTKEQIKSWIDSEAQSPNKQAAKLFAQAAFKGQAAAEDSMGTKDRVDAFTRDQIIQKHADLLSCPENICISFAGDITTEKAKAMAEQYFGHLQSVTEKPELDVEFIGGDNRQETDSAQLNLILGFEAPSFHDDDRYAAYILNQILGGGMSFPLFIEVREKRGLVYSVQSQYAPDATTGKFVIAAGTGKGQAAELLDTTFGIFEQFMKDGFTDDQIKMVADKLHAGRIGGLETILGASKSNASSILDHGEIKDFDEVYEKLRAVTSEDLKKLCHKMFSGGKYAFGGFGPLDTMPTEDEIKAKMQKIADLYVPDANAPAAPKLTDKPLPFTPKTGLAEPQVTELANGMKVVSVEQAGPLACGAWVGAGSIHETEALSGATHMNEHMMFKGTPSFPAGSIDTYVEQDLGGHLNAYTSKDQTCYYFYDLKAEALSGVLDLCGEMVFEADIAEVEFDGHTITDDKGQPKKMKGERDVVIEEIKRSNDSLMSVLWDTVYKTAYPDQPQGWPILGTEDGLRAMTSQMLRDYRDEFYVPNNVVFSAAGPIKHEDFVDMVEKKFGQMPQSSFPATQPPVYKGGVAYTEMSAAQLCNYSVTVETVDAGHDDSVVYNMLASIVGQGETARLKEKLVYQDKLTSVVAAFQQEYAHCGHFTIFSYATADKAKQIHEAIYATLRDTVGTITQDDLDKVKKRFELMAISEYEKNRAACDTMGSELIETGRVTDLETQLENISNVTLDDLNDALEHILSADPTVAAVVPKGTDLSLLPDEQEVLVVRDQYKFPGSGAGNSVVPGINPPQP